MMTPWVMLLVMGSVTEKMGNVASNTASYQKPFNFSCSGASHITQLQNLVCILLLVTVCNLSPSLKVNNWATKTLFLCLCIETKKLSAASSVLTPVKKKN